MFHTTQNNFSWNAHQTQASISTLFFKKKDIHQKFLMPEEMKKVTESFGHYLGKTEVLDHQLDLQQRQPVIKKTKHPLHICCTWNIKKGLLLNTFGNNQLKIDVMYNLI